MNLVGYYIIHLPFFFTVVFAAVAFTQWWFDCKVACIWRTIRWRKSSCFLSVKLLKKIPVVQLFYIILQLGEEFEWRGQIFFCLYSFGGKHSVPSTRGFPPVQWFFLKYIGGFQAFFTQTLKPSRTYKIVSFRGEIDKFTLSLQECQQFSRWPPLITPTLWRTSSRDYFLFTSKQLSDRNATISIIFGNPLLKTGDTHPHSSNQIVVHSRK